MSVRAFPFAAIPPAPSSLAPKLALPAVLLAATALSAQRFDAFDFIGIEPGGLFAHLAVEPVSGLVTGVRANQTLLWNGSAFVASTTAGPAPAVGQLETMASFSGGLVYLDAAGRTHVLSGSGAWNNLGVLTPSPSARAIAATTTTVGTSGEAFVFGGANVTATLNDLWSFNGIAWTKRSPAGATPAPRIGAALAHDGRGGLILFGGRTASGVNSEVWTFRNGAWTQQASAPISREFHGMAFDLARRQVVVAGGHDAAGPALDCFLVTVSDGGDPLTWSMLSNLTVPAPGPQPGSAFCYVSTDPVRHEPVIVLSLDGHVFRDRTASALVVATNSPVGCQAANLQIVNPPAEPRLGVGLLLGGLVGGGVPMLLFGSFVAAGAAPSPSVVPGSGCLAFLPLASTLTIAFTTSNPAGGYVFPFAIPTTPSMAGLNIDLQALGLNGAVTVASDALRLVIGR